MTCAEIAQYACDTVGDRSSDALDYAKRSLRFKYRVLYRAHAWRESLRELGPSQFDPNLNGSIFLPYDADEVIFLSVSFDGGYFTRFRYRERDWIERNVGAMLAANPVWPGLGFFYRAENLAWPYYNPGKFAFTSSDISPFTVRIEGTLANGQFGGESFSLNAIQDTLGNIIPASVVTVNSYTQATSLATSGSSQPLLIFTDNQPTTYSLQSGTNSLVYSQVVVPGIQFTAQIPWYRTQIKLKPDPLVDDLSVPRITQLDDALIAFVTSALWKRQRNTTKSDAEEQKGIQHMQAAVNQEKNQAEFSQQVVPTLYDESARDDPYPYQDHIY
jgi:hypothetical protein